MRQKMATVVLVVLKMMLAQGPEVPKVMAAPGLLHRDLYPSCQHLHTAADAPAVVAMLTLALPEPVEPLMVRNLPAVPAVVATLLSFPNQNLPTIWELMMQVLILGWMPTLLRTLGFLATYLTLLIGIPVAPFGRSFSNLAHCRLASVHQRELDTDLHRFCFFLALPSSC
jgi:hypothetical protein